MIHRPASRPLRWVCRTLVVGVPVLLAVLLAARPAGPTPIVQAQSQSQSMVYNNCESIDTFTVPDGVTRLQAQVWGAQGGDGGGNSGHGTVAMATVLGSSSKVGRGGQGSYVSGTIPVKPGEQLTVIVGCSSGHGINSGVGYTDGGPGGIGRGASGKDGGVGGGSSALVTGPAGSSNGTPLVVAGGGGGGGGAGLWLNDANGGNGGDGTAPPEAGQSGEGPGAGDGGCAGCVTGPIGGEGTNSNAFEDGGGGGGGGGGYPLNGGGGHGADEGGGGGGGGGAGQSYADPSVINLTFEVSTRSGDGLIILSWTPSGAGQTPPDQQPPGAQPPGAGLPSVRCGDTVVTPQTPEELAALRLRCGAGVRPPLLPGTTFRQPSR